MKEEEFIEVDSKKDELFNTLKELSKKPVAIGREEVSSGAILEELIAIKKDLHLVTIILLIWFAFFVINLIYSLSIG